MKGINGRVDLGEASESAEISGVNGSISVALKSLSERGARVSGVNGAIELKIVERSQRGSHRERHERQRAFRDS